MNEKECLGKKIRTLRKAKKITQKKFAEMIDVCPRHMVKIEMGYVYPSFVTLKKISSVLGVSLQSLFENEHYDNPENLKQKLCEIICNLDEKNLRFLYVVASHLD